MIIATAGHVDHGKTTLVKALTGIDTDRLQEEKQRGMTIEAGFAYADLGTPEPVAFVDVPGHERFIRNMLAGVASVDFALLVIAADDGPMPQTVEHLAILELMGLKRAAVALTKIDRVTPERVDEVRAQIDVLLSATRLKGAPIYPVAANAGDGVRALRHHLADVAMAMPARSTSGNFRLAVDRGFSLPGAGLIVTGAVFSGSARVGDELLVSPAGVPLRVRNIHLHNRPAELATAGRRCALNLAGSGLKRASIERGDWIVAPAAHAPTERIDVRIVRIALPASQDRALRHGAPVHLHIGASVVNARVALLEGSELEPGGSALAQLVVDRPIAALSGDRFILRDQSAQHTLGGGTVIDPFGSVRGRAKPGRLLQLHAVEQGPSAEALGRLLAVQPDGVPLRQLEQGWNLTPEESSLLFQKRPVVRFDDGPVLLGVAAEHWQSVREQVRAHLRKWHGEHPEGVGPSEALLAQSLGFHVFPPLWRAACKSLYEDGLVVRDGISMRLHDHHPRLSEEDAALLCRVSSILRSAGLRPPVIGELARQLDDDQARLMTFLERAAGLGHVVRVAKNRFFLPVALNELVDIAVQLSAESDSGLFDAATYRDRSGIGRNLTIEVLEFMDRARITRFAGGRRRMLT